MVYRIGFTDADLYSVYTSAQSTAGSSELQRIAFLSQIDLGTRSLGYTQTAARSPAASGDSLIDSSELFEALVSRTSLHTVYQRFAAEPLPWLATSGTATQTLLTQFDEMVSRWRREHPDESRTGEAMARAIYNWVRSVDGMGMRHDAGAPELNIDQIVAQRRGDCTEFAKIFILLLSRAGYSPFPVWVQRDLNGEETVHIVAGLEIGGRTVVLDPVYGRFNPAHRSVSRMSSREFLAWHWNNRALDVQATNPTEAQRLFTRALMIDPSNPHFLTNRGMFRIRRARTLQDEAASLSGDERTSRLEAARTMRASGVADFNAAVHEVSNFHYANFQLGNIEYDAGRYGEAVTFYRRAVTSSPSNESYSRNLILALYSNGATRDARRELGRLIDLHPGQTDLVRLVGTPIRA